MCRYTFINYKEDQIIVSIKPSSNINDDDEDTGKKPRVFSFNHEKVKHIYFNLRIQLFIVIFKGIHIQYY